MYIQPYWLCIYNQRHRERGQATVQYELPSTREQSGMLQHVLRYVCQTCRVAPGLHSALHVKCMCDAGSGGKKRTSGASGNRTRAHTSHLPILSIPIPILFLPFPPRPFNPQPVPSRQGRCRLCFTPGHSPPERTRVVMTSPPEGDRSRAYDSGSLWWWGALRWGGAQRDLNLDLLLRLGDIESRHT